jgi:hypothetical protein
MRHLLCLLLLLPGSACAQLSTDDAHVNLYFPAVLDGGPTTGQWQTVFTFTNPSATPASIVLSLFSNDGAELPLDLGAGAGAKWRISVPAYGVRSYASKATSGNIISGWAFGSSNVPVRATAALRQLQTGNMRYEVPTESTLPSMGYIMPAQTSAVVSLANVYSDLDETIVLTLRDGEGKQVGQRSLKLSSGNRVMFLMSEVFSSMAQGFAERTGVRDRSRNRSHPPAADRQSGLYQR